MSCKKGSKDLNINVTVGQSPTTGCEKPAYDAVGVGCGCDVGVALVPTDGLDTCLDPCATSQAADGCSAPCEANTSLYAIATAPFNMPACGATAEMFINDALRFAPGSMLYNPGVGSLYVAGVRDNFTLLVRNDCGSCQVLQPGQVVAQNTVFALGGPSCLGNAQSVGSPETTPFLDSDFVVPQVGQCATAKVTNVFGIGIGDIESIHGFEFRVGAIIDGTTIQLCNDGDGGEPNSVIEHDPDGDTVPNYPIVRVGGENPCSVEAVSTAKRIIGCSGAGLLTGIEGSIEGHILVWNEDDEQWDMRVLEGGQTCVVMSQDLVVDAPNDDFEYAVFTSGDNSLLVAEWEKVTPNFLQIMIGDKAFCMTGPVSTGAIRARKAYVQTGIDVLPAGTLICILGCCEQCVPYVETSDLADGADPAISETGAIVNITTWSAPAGVSVRTFPVGIGINDAGETPDTDALWALKYVNGENSCACRKYLEIMSNFECAIDLQNGVYANVEFRMIKVLPNQSTQAFAAIPFGTNRRLLAALDGTPNGLVGGNPGNYGTVNTYKGFMFDRDIVEPGVLHQYQGHIRIIVENTTGGALDVSFAASVRAWLKSSNFELVADPTA